MESIYARMLLCKSAFSRSMPAGTYGLTVFT